MVASVWPKHPIQRRLNCRPMLHRRAGANLQFGKRNRPHLRRVEKTLMPVHLDDGKQIRRQGRRGKAAQAAQRDDDPRCQPADDIALHFQQVGDAGVVRPGLA